MGGFMIWDIGFTTKKQRKNFEELMKGTIKTLVDEYTDSQGFAAWKTLRTPEIEPIYFAGFMGYEDSHAIMKEAEEKGIQFNYFASIAINDREGNWQVLKEEE
jgi:hypothetical protein